MSFWLVGFVCLLIFVILFCFFYSLHLYLLLPFFPFPIKPPRDTLFSYSIPSFWFPVANIWTLGIMPISVISLYNMTLFYLQYFNIYLNTHNIMLNQSSYFLCNVHLIHFWNGLWSMPCYFRIVSYYEQI